jgi:plasmid stabilization system protein ParE
MAQALIWSREALDDIDRSAEYISRDSRYHAEQVVERLFDLADELPVHPQLGRIVPDARRPKRARTLPLQLPIDLRNLR